MGVGKFPGSCRDQGEAPWELRWQRPETPIQSSSYHSCGLLLKGQNRVNLRKVTAQPRLRGSWVSLGERSSQQPAVTGGQRDGRGELGEELWQQAAVPSHHVAQERKEEAPEGLTQTPWAHTGCWDSGHMRQPDPASWHPGRRARGCQEAPMMPPAQGSHMPLGRWLPMHLPALPQQRVLPEPRPQLHLHLLLRLRGQELRLR